MARKDWVAPANLSAALWRAFFDEWGCNYDFSWAAALNGQKHHIAYMEWMVDHIKDRQALARMRGQVFLP